MRIYLVRHGETAHNRDGLGLGRDDVPLTERGLAQADRVVGRLSGESVTAVYTSPLQRAAAMAERIAARLDLVPVVREELIELDVGDTEGLPFAEVHSRFPDFIEQWRGPGSLSAVMPGGESLADVDRRLAGFLDELLVSHRDGAVVLVSHNFVLRLAICRLLRIEPERFRVFIADLASVSEIVVDGDHRTLELLNDTCHLFASDLES